MSKIAWSPQTDFRLGLPLTQVITACYREATQLQDMIGTYVATGYQIRTLSALQQKVAGHTPGVGLV